MWLLAALLLHAHGQVSGRDLVVFTAYVGVFLTIPGTIAWRWLSTRTGRPLVEDLVLGTVLGYVLELPVYLFCRAVGAPLFTIAWPILLVAVSLASRRGRQLWQPRRVQPMPVAWSWSMAVIVAFSAAWLAKNVWSVSPLTDPALRAPYVDEPFHLALIGELRHHFPAEVPYVDGVQLFYHWLTYVHVASSSWLTGIEPVVLIRMLTSTAAIALTVLGAAVVTNRLTGRTWPGAVVAGLLILVTPLDTFGWTVGSNSWAGARYLSGLLYLGPTQTFATLIYLLLILLTVETIRDNKAPRRMWAVLALLLVVVAGSKSTFLPTAIAGLLGALGLGLLLKRRLHRSTAILTGLAVAAFLVAQQIFYGPGARSLTWSPFTTVEGIASVRPGLVDDAGSVPTAVVAIVGVSYVLAHVAAGAGVVGLLVRGGWREPATQFLCGTYAAAMGATLLLDHPARGQSYFLLAGTIPLLVLSGLGLSRLVTDDSHDRAAIAGVAGAAGGLLTATAVAAVSTSSGPTAANGSPTSEAIRTYVVPQLLALALLVAVALVGWLATTRLGWSRTNAVVLAVAAVMGLGLTRAAAESAALFETPWPAPTAVSRPTRIAGGGIDAARWLRAHSSPNDLAATNAHCTQGPVPDCERRNFWIAGYAERRVLVEGWAYVAPQSVGQPSNELTNSAAPPFWDEQRLEDNDRAFERPTPENIARLRDVYGVDWLFVDLRFPADLDRLEQVADLKFRGRGHAVLKVRPADYKVAP